MSSTESWVLEAIDTLGIAAQVRRIVEPERSQLLNRVAATFLQKPNVTFWWSHLIVPWSSWPAESGFTYLPRLAPDPTAPCWLITGLTDDEKGVFECPAAVTPDLIGECPGFEYALVDPDLKWMVIENHHDILIAAGDAAARLDELRQQSDAS